MQHIYFLTRSVFLCFLTAAVLITGCKKETGPEPDENRIFLEEFDNNDNDWFIGEHDDGLSFSRIEDGNFVFYNENPGHSWHSGTSKRLFSSKAGSRAIEASIKNDFGKTCFGISFADNGEEYYSFEVDALGYYTIRYNPGPEGDLEYIVDWTFTDAYKAKEWNILRIEHTSSDSVYFSVNGETVASGTLDNFTGLDRLGFLVCYDTSSDPEPVQWRVDWLKGFQKP